MDGVRVRMSRVAVQVGAKQRIYLRRWLRLHTPPGCAWLCEWHDFNLERLRDAVIREGGDPDLIMEKAREEVVNEIINGESGFCVEDFSI